MTDKIRKNDVIEKALNAKQNSQKPNPPKAMPTSSNKKTKGNTNEQ